MIANPGPSIKSSSERAEGTIWGGLTAWVRHRVLRPAVTGLIIAGPLLFGVWLGTLLSGTAQGMAFAAQVAASLAWPIVVVVVAFLFHGELRHLLRRIERIKIRFQRHLLELSMRGARDSLAQTPVAEEVSPVIERPPREAIIEKWLSIESELRELVTTVEAGAVPPQTYRGLAMRIRAKRYLSKEVMDAGDNLRRVYREVRRMPRKAITREDAEEFVALAARALAAINQGRKAVADTHQRGV